jgi:hypothetical protein
MASIETVHEQSGPVTRLPALRAIVMHNDNIAVIEFDLTRNRLIFSQLTEPATRRKRLAVSTT